MCWALVAADLPKALLAAAPVILKPVASQNIDDRSAQGHLPISVVVIVKYHVFLACQHIKYGIDALALFVHGDDLWRMAFEPSVVAHVAGLSRSGDRLIAVCANWFGFLPFFLVSTALRRPRIHTARSQHRK
jgi:hypothetical protein